jgi:hypothetical protein
MVIVCAWCQRYMGSSEPLDSHEVSHGICAACSEHEQRSLKGIVIVVSRERANVVPLLRELCSSHEAAILVDRRVGERRARPPAPDQTFPEKRSRDRRRDPALRIV